MVHIFMFLYAEVNWRLQKSWLSAYWTTPRSWAYLHFHSHIISLKVFLFFLKTQTVLWNTVATECQGDGDLLNNVHIKDLKTGEEKDLPVHGLFYAIGMAINHLCCLFLVYLNICRTWTCDWALPITIRNRFWWLHYHCPRDNTDIGKRCICSWWCSR